MTVHFTQLFALLASQGDYDRLADALVVTEKEMQSSGEIDLWRYWKGQCLIGLDQPEAALELVAQIDDSDRAAIMEIIATRAVAKRDGDWQKLISLLERRYSDTNDPLDLFELCQAYQFVDNWEGILSNSEILVEQIATVSALRLAIEAAHRLKKYEPCIALMKRGEHLFPEARLPQDLRRLRISCLRSLGRIEMAIPEAEHLAKETADSGDILTLISMRLDGADLKGAAVDSRELLRRPDVAPVHHLQIARALATEDAATANEHLNRAMATSDRSPEFLAQAVDLVFRLNREDMFAELQPAFTEAAKNGGRIKLAQLENIPELLQNNARHQQAVETAYKSGAVPLHAVTEALNGTIGQVMDSHFHPIGGGSQYSPKSAIFVLHGGRRVRDDLQSISCLILDITSLLLAAELRLLDSMEQTFGTLYLPPSAIKSIYDAIGKIEPHQPSKIDEAQVLVQLHKNGKFKFADEYSASNDESGNSKEPASNWQALLDSAIRTKGYLIDYLPLTAGIEMNPVEVTEEEMRHIAGIGSVFSNLEGSGLLEVNQIEHGRKILNHYINSEPIIDLVNGSDLYLWGNIASVLVGAGIMSQVCDRFQVYVESDEIQRAEAVLEYAGYSAQMRGRLRAILDRVQRGISGGTWRLIPEATDSSQEVSTYELQCLAELIGAEAAPGTYICLDDRFLNAHTSCGPNPIITTIDILTILRKRSAISEFEYHNAMHQARVANLRHLPIGSDDIVFHLKNAPIDEQKLAETPELAVLRRYIAAALSEGEWLQLPPIPEGAPNPMGESEYVPLVLSEIRQSIISLWSEVSVGNLEDTVARADWLLENLWADIAVLPGLLNKDQELAASVGAEAIGLSHLYLQGVQLRGKGMHAGNEGPSPRSVYFTWLVRRFGQDQETLASTANHLKSMVESEQLVEGRTKQEQEIFGSLLGELLEELPEQLRRNIVLSEEVQESVGIRTFSAIEIGRWSFDHESFWYAAAKAVAGIEAKIKTVNSEAEFELKAKCDGYKISILLKHADSAETFEVEDPFLCLLFDVEEKRKEALLAHSELFDVGREVLTKEIDRIASVADVVARMNEAEKWRANSVSRHFADLILRRDSQQGLNLKWLRPPPLSAFLNHLRIPSHATETEVCKLVANAATMLASDYGFSETFRRLAALPLRMPESIHHAFQALSDEERASWFSKATEEFITPIGQLHLAALSCHSNPEVAVSLIENLTGENGRESFNAFNVILRWILDCFEREANTARFSNCETLLAAWESAARLHNVLGPICPSKRIVEYFSPVLGKSGDGIFRAFTSMHRDVAHPRTLYYDRLVAHGLGCFFDPEVLNQRTKEVVREALRRCCFNEIDAVTIASIDLMTPADWYENCIGSFLGLDLGKQVDQWLGEDAELLSTKMFHGVACDILRDLAENTASDATKWSVIGAIVSDLKVPHDLHDLLSPLFAADFIADLADLDNDTRGRAIAFYQQQIQHFEEKSDSIEHGFIEYIKRVGNSPGASTWAPDVARQLLEVAHAMACSRSAIADGTMVFHRVVLAGIDNWTVLNSEVWKAFRSHFFKLPASVGVYLWPMLLRLRKQTLQDQRFPSR